MIFKLKEKNGNLIYAALFAFIGIVIIMGAQLDLMDIDSSQYASISKEMFLSGSYLQVFSHGEDYLDKPPLVFWTACLSFHIFGVHDWAFRLPSILVLVLGIYATYRFALIFYSTSTAKLAALIAASCQAVFLMTHDVRTDTMLTGLVMFAIWQLAAFFQTEKTLHIVWAAIGIGLAMLTKGPIGLVIPLVAFSIHFLYTRQWRNFFRWQYLLALFIIAFLLAPMTYGLYLQYDLHPEKIVYGLNGPSGVRFYYWTQSFGRITGENYWDNNPDTFFLLHSFLWSFLPWTLFFVPAIYNAIKLAVRNMKNTEQAELITLGGFVFIFLFLSLSHYQLPHYTFCIHPLAAIITANYLNTHVKQTAKLFGFTVFVLTILAALLLFLLIVVFPAAYALAAFYAVLFLLVLCIAYANRKHLFLGTIAPLVFAITLTNSGLNARFYPLLLNYQADSKIAQYVNAQHASKNLVTYTTDFFFSHDFYLKKPLLWHTEKKTPADFDANDIIATNSEGYKQLLAQGRKVKVEKMFFDYSVSLLSWKFLNPDTRTEQLKVYYLVSVYV
jgi:4-amino-4-deoxy-L-arabinose transferase-like glycosyltransferase